MAYKGSTSFLRNTATAPMQDYIDSNWERKFMVYCDRNDDIVYWSNEELIILYFGTPVTKKVHDIFLTLS